MNLGNAFDNAVSGLQASARGVGVTSSNIANALVEGYAPRRLTLAAQTGGGGVLVAGISRQADPMLAGLFRQATAEQAGTTPRAAFLNQIEQAFGLPGDSASLSGRVAAFEAAIIDAADRPDLEYRLGTVAQSARALVQQINGLERQLQEQRLQADRAIATEVEALNAGLEQVARLNAEIVKTRGAGAVMLDLVEERERVMASLSETVPIRVLTQSDGRVALFSATGHMLLEGTQPVRFGFVPSPSMTAGMHLDNGSLSGLTADGQPVSMAGGGPLAGGRLAAQFAIRDTDAPQIQAMLDGLAAELINRFQAPGTDPSLPPGSAGLFTDAGAPLGGPALTGLAGRLMLDAVGSTQGAGDLWRLRDGLGAAAPGSVGDPAQLLRWLDALEEPRAAGPGLSARSFAEHVAHGVSDLSMVRQQAENLSRVSQARHDTLYSAMRAGGVDTDTELQTLLTLEKAYAANARVLQVTDDLLRRLMEI
ncbi:MAG: flagellar hook-associated protein FlgK [Pararhodobacter sp.]